MCCFSAPVDSVKGTRIFARSAADGRQFLVYEMSYAAREDVAMILPLPVPEKSADDAVRFISLQEYRDFFVALESGFPKPRTLSVTPSKPEVPVAAAPLPVVEVGDFEASFVPSIADFKRLDARFRLPDGTWDKLPAYRTYGFAVFKLKKGAGVKAHPMAFEFPRADPRRLYFPTVHIHDGTVKEKAGFDHVLYAQSNEGELLQFTVWTESPQPASHFVHIARSKGLVAGDRHVHRHEIRGERKNEDVLV